MTVEEMIPRWNLCATCKHPIFLIIIGKWRHCIPIIAAKKCFVKQCDCVVSLSGNASEIKKDLGAPIPQICPECNIGKFCQCADAKPLLKENLFVIPSYDKMKVVE